MTYDERPFISDLLSEHSRAIEAVREAILADSIGRHLHSKGSNSKRYDDIWILRYVLSHKSNVNAATRAALGTMKFREEKKLNELGDIRHRIKNLGVDTDDNNDGSEWLPGQEFFNACCEKDAFFMFQPDKDRGVVEIIDVGMIDMHKIAKGMRMYGCDWADFGLYANEAHFQLLDYVTRSTGRLTKLFRVFEMGNVTFSKISYDYIKQDAAACKLTEDFYPQHLGTACLVNCPGWMNRLWKMGRHLFPKRVVEKVHLLLPASKVATSEDGLGTVLRYISEDHLPEKYGGKNSEWPLPAAGKYYATEGCLQAQ